MTPPEQLAALLAEAEPLRSLPAEEQETAGLRQIVDRINALRAAKVEIAAALDSAVEEGHEAEFAEVAESAKRKPGRPRKEA